MYNKKMKDIPQFRPNSYGQMAIYCDDRTDHEFVMKCITHRREIEPQLPALDLKRDSDKNHFFSASHDRHACSTYSRTFGCDKTPNGFS